MLLTPEQYNQWIEEIRVYHFPLPEILVGDMNNWRNRSIVARALVRTKKYEQAIVIFKTLLDVEVNLQIDELSFFTEVEDKTWCLLELASCLWKMEKERDEILNCCFEVLAIVETNKQQFTLVNENELKAGAMKLIELVL